MTGKKTRRSVPDYIRRGLRQGVGVGALVAAGYEVVQPFDEHSGKLSSQWLTCFKWAAITLIVLTAPVLGKVAQVSSERTIGTLAGGGLGLLTVLLGREMMQASDQVFTAIISGLVAFGAVCLGHYLKLEYAGKLLAMTYILVIIGADGRVDAFNVALTRCSGIILGVFLSVILAVLIFPKSASHQATDNLSEALFSICKLCQLAWTHSPGESRQNSATSSESVQGRYEPLDDIPVAGAQDEKTKEEREVECEKVLMEIYDKLSKADDLLPLAKREQYMFTFRGRWCFLPTLPFCNTYRWTIPAKQMQELATAVRQVSRVLWALHVTFKQGLDGEILTVLRQRFPPETMQDLQNFSFHALEDMRDAFPDDTILPSTSLHNFSMAVESLISISNEQRNALLQFAAASKPGQLRSSHDFGKPSSSNQIDIQSTAYQEGEGVPVWQNFPGDLQGANTFQNGSAPARSESIQFNEGQSSPVLSVEKIDGFSLTSEGYLCKVRWLSFQFLMQHLADELEDMHKCLAVVLKMMPNAVRSRERWNA